MEIIENKENLVSVLTVKVSKEDYLQPVEKALKKIKQTIQMKGFRPGAVPMSIVKRLHESTIRADEIDKLLSKELNEYLKDRPLVGNIIPLDKDTEIDFNRDDFEFMYEAGFFSESEFRLSEDIELPYYNIILNSDTIDAEMLRYREMYGKYDTPDAIGENDSISALVYDPEADLESEIESEDAEHSETQADDNRKLKISVRILISHIPDEYKSLFIGAAVDTVIDIELRKVFPNETDLCSMLNISKERLEKTPEIVKLRVDSIWRLEPAELNQEFFNRISEEDSVHNEEEWRNYISQKLRERYDNDSLSLLLVEFKKTALEKSDISLSEDFVKKMIRFNNKDISEEDLEKNIQPLVESLKWSHITDTLLKHDNITVSDEEIVEAARLRAFTQMYRYNVNYNKKEEFERLVYYMIEKEGRVIVEDLKSKKLMSLLKDKIKLDSSDVSADDFLKIHARQFQNMNKKDETAMPTEAIATETTEVVTENTEQTENYN